MLSPQDASLALLPGFQVEGAGSMRMSTTSVIFVTTVVSIAITTLAIISIGSFASIVEAVVSFAREAAV